MTMYPAVVRSALLDIHANLLRYNYNNSDSFTVMLQDCVPQTQETKKSLTTIMRIMKCPI